MMQDKLIFIDGFSNSLELDIESYPLKFIPYEGWMPMIITSSTYKKSGNLYFQGIHYRSIHSRVWNHINPLMTNSILRYRITRNWNGPNITLSSGFLTIMGIKENFEYLPSTLFNEENINYKLIGDVDIFCLGVVKISKLPEIKYIVHNYRSSSMRYRTRIEINFDISAIKILISEEKLRKTLFTKKYYTGTIRNAILEKISKIETKYGIKVEDVSEDYLKNFMIRPNAVRTKSFVEIMELNKEIKDSVFPNLNTLIV
jgi:hypothetical protein